jgi:hypothetical protein
MLNRLEKPCSRGRRICTSYGLGLLAVSAILILFSQAACFLKKNKTPVAPAPPARIVLLPFNIPSGNKDLHWAAFAAPILMAKACEQTSDLVLVPLWEALPAATESAGASRAFNQASAAATANWLSAKWSSVGEISPTKTGVSMTVDFIPAKSNEVPFRYMKSRSINLLPFSFHQAIRQFLHYVAAKPLKPARGTEQNMKSVKALAEALDREYGWFVNADPGKAQEIVADLARTDERLARFLFNPSLYPVLAQGK